jgi:hypothetical protein
VKSNLFRASAALTVLLMAVMAASATDHKRDIFVLTSTNDAVHNQVVIFKLNVSATPSLAFLKALPTGGAGGASGNAGAVQFANFSGAVVNYGSNNVTQLVREGDFIGITRNIPLAPNCVKPVSVALSQNQMYVIGANCAESHSWPWGFVDGSVVPISDSSSAQIVTGNSWAAVTLKSGSVLQLPLTWQGALNGVSRSIPLPSEANDTPLGAAFWGDILAINPAHSPDSFALVNKNGNVSPVLGPQPAYPSNAPCWLAKGPGNVWYSGNSPADAISIFFSDGQGGTFYKSVPLPGVPTDLTVSQDGKWLAVIYTAADGSGARIAVFAVDVYGGLSLAATSSPIGVASFNGVAISE